MTIHSLECERYLHELQCAPTDSVERDMAEFLLNASDIDAVEFLLTVIDEDPADSRPAEIAAKVWHLDHLTGEVAQ